MVRGSVMCAVALVAMSAVVPVANAQHCDTKINVYGRASLAPLPPPPYVSTTAGICVRVLGDNGVEDHILPPNTDQIMVRIQGDFGSSIPSVRVTLNGLGFLNQEYLAYRTLNAVGNIHSYDFREWVPLPDGPTDGNLTVSVKQPGGVVRTVTYRTTLTVEPPAVPPAP